MTDSPLLSTQAQVVKVKWAAATGGHKLRPFLAAKWLRRYGFGLVLEAIDLLAESLANGHTVANPEGWVTSALAEQWLSNAEAAREAEAARAEKQRELQEAYRRDCARRGVSI